jgi:Flp pilus assembly pilin Flp
MFRTLKRIAANESRATAIEYGLGLIAVFIIGAVSVVGTSPSMTAISDSI